MSNPAISFIGQARLVGDERGGCKATLKNLATGRITVGEGADREAAIAAAVGVRHLEFATIAHDIAACRNEGRARTFSLVVVAREIFCN